jgi:5-methylcytosine-specific restriction endonuclease McrA
MNKASADYEAKNKDKRGERDKKRGEAGAGARAAFDDATKRVLFAKQNGICRCCMKPISSIAVGQVDHVIPLSKGGEHHPSNFMLAHSQCNKEKHNKTLAEHWEWRVLNGLDEENLGRKHGLLH